MMDIVDYKACEKFYSDHQITDVNIDKLLLLVKKAVMTGNSKLLDYERFVGIGTQNKGETIELDSYKQLLYKTYRLWWNEWLIPTVKGNYKTDFSLDRYREFLNNPKNDPNNIDSKNILEKMYEIDKSYFYYRTWKFQWADGKNIFCSIDTNSLTRDRLKYHRMWCQARLYLTTDLKNTTSVANKLIEKALETDTPLNMKFALYDGRNDSFVLYTDFKYLERLTGMVEEVVRENRELFRKIQNPLLARYNQYIGYGEEPFSFGSYTSERVEILQRLYNELSKQYKDDKECLREENIKACFKRICKMERINSECFYKSDDEEQRRRITNI